LTARYLTWRRSLAGVAAFGEIERRALAAAQAGAGRIEVNRLVAEIRAERRERINNSFRALISRDLRDAHPALRPLIEVRERRAL
jgi:hypothetical protein